MVLDAVIVGAVGHRFLAREGRLRLAVNEALDGILSRSHKGAITVISSLAEGADRLVAEEALRRADATLVAPLPMARDEYVKDFAGPSSVGEFASLLARASEVIELPMSASRELSYQHASDVILERCDVLLAIWDGLGEQGRGGTGAIVARARDMRRPIAWVHAGNRKPGTTEPTSLGREQGVVTYENFS